MSREPSPSELAEDLAEIKAAVAALGAKIDSLPYVRGELFEAKHSALRNEFALEVARMSAELAAERAARESGDKQNEERSLSARAAAMWALGIMCTVVIGALVAFAAQAGGS